MKMIADQEEIYPKEIQVIIEKEMIIINIVIALKIISFPKRRNLELLHLLLIIGIKEKIIILGKIHHSIRIILLQKQFIILVLIS